MTQKKLTTDEAKARMRERGETLRDFANKHGFRPDQVYAVTAGRVKATRGVSHQIAVALGIK